MYKKYMSNCFSNKRFVLTLFALSLMIMLFGASLYAVDSIKDTMSLRATASVEDTAPVSFPVEYSPQYFLENTLDYGFIVFRSGKQEVPAWNMYSSSFRQDSAVTTDHATSVAIQASAIVQNVSDRGDFYLRC